jgi:hypothetical protein
MAVLGIRRLVHPLPLRPDRRLAKWRWVMPGAMLATLVWIATSLVFSVYVAHFGSYDKTLSRLDWYRHTAAVDQRTAARAALNVLSWAVSSCSRPPQVHRWQRTVRRSFSRSPLA